MSETRVGARVQWPCGRRLVVVRQADGRHSHSCTHRSRSGPASDVFGCAQAPLELAGGSTTRPTLSYGRSIPIRKALTPLLAQSQLGAACRTRAAHRTCAVDDDHHVSRDRLAAAHAGGGRGGERGGVDADDLGKHRVHRRGLLDLDRVRGAGAGSTRPARLPLIVTHFGVYVDRDAGKVRAFVLLGRGRAVRGVRSPPVTPASSWPSLTSGSSAARAAAIASEDACSWRFAR